MRNRAAPVDAVTLQRDVDSWQGGNGMAFVVAGIVAVALLLYLVYALFHPDKLS